jgi:hypothetical protein
MFLQLDEWVSINPYVSDVRQHGESADLGALLDGILSQVDAYKCEKAFKAAY